MTSRFLVWLAGLLVGNRGVESQVVRFVSEDKAFLRREGLDISPCSEGQTLSLRKPPPETDPRTPKGFQNSVIIGC
eukprot:5791460-Amphidinium_carterae.1